jgi:hypothetical protein
MDSAYLSSVPACACTLMPVIRTHDDDDYPALRGGSSLRYPCRPCVFIVRPDPWCHISMLNTHSPLLAPQSTRLKSRPYPLICPFGGSLKADLDQRVRLPF